MEKVISVIVPLYNASDYMDYSIESIVKSSYKALEIILVVNKSKDNTLEKSLNWKEKDSRIRCIELDNAGVSHARNVALKEAKGEYITFVDGDDCIRSDMLAILVQGLQKGADIAGCDYEPFSNIRECAWGRKIIIAVPPAYKLTDRKGFLSEHFLHGNTRCWSKLYRKECLQGVEFPEDLTIGEDMLFLLQAVENAEKIAYTDYKGYLYLLNQDGAMRRKFVPAYMDQITCWERVETQMKEEDLQSRLQIKRNMAMAVMLVAGKMAMLSKEERRAYEQLIKECQQKVKQLLAYPEVTGELSRGYRMKLQIFSKNPRMYMNLYHLWKK